jgi:Na+-transporting methylmalonyl-CoA/oxaloacetate decarboxylase gamma subunit
MKVFVNCRGVSLVIALLILLVVTLIGISAIQTTTFETNMPAMRSSITRPIIPMVIDYFHGTSQPYIR